MYYVKNSIIPFVYLFFTSIIAAGVLQLGDHLAWLKIILLVLNAGLYFVVTCATSFKDGQEAFKVLIANDLERMQIIKTGEDRPIKRMQEYKPFKGFITGLIVCSPLILLCIVHVILVNTAGPTYVGAGAVAGFIYMIAYGFTRVTAGVAAIFSGPYAHLISLTAAALIIPATGIAYIIGGKKIKYQQEKIKEKQRQIYGD